MRYEVTFIGRVQGVGFRATAHSLARDRDVVGWIRNEPDGSVKLVVEGKKDVLDPFLDELRGKMSGLISEEKVEETPERGNYVGFEIRY
ncbi:MAG: acylphosphatase [Planctomycetota bacterium]|nr:acylphosphatase [Planctomycetota bacterium]